MKVVLKASILDKIQERLYTAKRDRREVDYILVTPEEYSQLRYEVGLGELCCGLTFSPKEPYSNYTIRDITLRNRRGVDQKFASYEKLLGYDLYVVPEEFIR